MKVYINRLYFLFTKWYIENFSLLRKFDICKWAMHQVLLYSDNWLIKTMFSLNLFDLLNMTQLELLSFKFKCKSDLANDTWQLKLMIFNIYSICTYTENLAWSIFYLQKIKVTDYYLYRK